MPTIDLLEQLDSAIALAAQEEPREPSRAAAERFYEDNAALVEHFKRPWTIEELARLIRRRRFKNRSWFYEVDAEVEALKERIRKLRRSWKR